MSDSIPAGAAAEAFGRALIAEANRRLIGECLPRIRTGLGQLSQEEIWRRPNSQTASVGNLVLHLCGNVRQWIVSGLGESEDYRDRDSEFAERHPITQADLINRLDNTLSEAAAVLDRVDPSSLLENHHVQGGEENGLSIIVHVVEHFSYHTGQIARDVKTLKDIDLGYYAGQDLNATN